MGEIKNSELFQRLKVYFLDMLQSSAGGPGPYSPTPHELQSAHHTGSIADSQATQFLKTDGTRQLVGSLGVAAGVLIDGVDISEFKNTYDAHALGAAAIAHNGVGVHNHQVDVGGGQLDHGLALSGLSDDDHTQYAMADGSGTRSAYMAERLNKSVLAGAGLTGGGLLTADETLAMGTPGSISATSVNGASGTTHTHAADSSLARSAINHTAGAGLTGGGNHTADTTFDVGAGAGITVNANDVAVNMGYAFTWTADHAFQGNISARHIAPEVTDFYDLGTSTKLWRKGYLSELEALVFAENTIFPIGGWFLLTKDQGTLPTELLDSAATYDFGKAMTPNDFIVFRASGVVEYIQIGSVISGTEYNITRNLDGSGANTWAAGSSWAALGYNGNGRIELNAYDTPRIQLLTQGATYNAQTEVIRLGDLVANWGYTAATYGLAIGEYGSGKVNLTIDPINGYRLRTYATTQFSVTPNLLKFGSDVSAAGTTAMAIFGADQTYNGEAVGNGDLLIGDNSASKANILWDKSTGKLLIRGGTTTQTYINTDGSINWGGGVGIMNASGICITAPASWDEKNAYAFKNASAYMGGMYANDDFSIFIVADATGKWKEETGFATKGSATISVRAFSYDQTESSMVALMATNYPEVGLPNQVGILCSTGIPGSIVYGSLYVGSSSGEAIPEWNTKFQVKDTFSVDTTNGKVKVNANNTTALLVEQYGIKNNVLVVDTTNGRVGINKQPTIQLDVSGDIYVSADVRIGSGLYVGSTSTAPADNWIYADGGMFINDTGNGNMSIGLTINQGANDNEILALKSSDVAHGVTSITETDTFALFQKYGANDGGIILRGLSETTVGVCLVGYAPTAETTKSTSVGAKVLINGYQTSETGTTNATADMNVFAIRTYKDSGTKTVFIVDEDGDVAVDGSSSIATYDEYDDVKLLTGLRASLMPEKAKLREQFSEWMEYAREPLSEAGVVTYNDDGHHFISLKGLHMLEIDAIRQLGEQLNRLVLEHAALVERLEQVDTRLALLADD